MRSIIGLFFFLSFFVTRKESELDIVKYPEVEFSSFKDSLYNNEIRIEFSGKSKEQGILHYLVSDKLLEIYEAEKIISCKSHDQLAASLVQLGNYKYKHFTRALKYSENYYIYSIFKTSDNGQSKIKVDRIRNIDTSPPKLLLDNCSPKHLQKTDLKLDIQLHFDEDIVLNDNSEVNIQIGYKDNPKHYLIKKKALHLNGNIISIKDDNITFDYNQYIIISAKEGAFKDLSGNNSKEIKGLLGSNFFDADYYFQSYSENELNNKII